MVGDGVHHGGEGDNMATHNKDRKENLTQTKELPPKATEEDLSSIGQVVNMGVPRTELSNGIPSVKSNDT